MTIETKRIRKSKKHNNILEDDMTYKLLLSEKEDIEYQIKNANIVMDISAINILNYKKHIIVRRIHNYLCGIPQYGYGVGIESYHGIDEGGSYE